MMMSTPLEERPPWCVIWPTDSADRNLWRAATDEARSGWERAYNGSTPSEAEAGLIRLLKGQTPEERAVAQLFVLSTPALEPAAALPEAVAA